MPFEKIEHPFMHALNTKLGKEQKPFNLIKISKVITKCLVVNINLHLMIQN